MIQEVVQMSGKHISPCLRPRILLAKIEIMARLAVVALESMFKYVAANVVLNKLHSITLHMFQIRLAIPKCIASTFRCHLDVII